MDKTEQDVFQWAISLIGKNYPMLFTPQGLTDLLSSAMYRGKSTMAIKLLKESEIYYALAGIEFDANLEPFLRRLAADPKGWSIGAEGVQDGADYYQRIGTILNGEAVAAIMVYRQIRDKVQELQVAKGISSIVGTREIKLMGQSTATVVDNDQLIRLPQDLHPIAESARRTIQLFVNAVLTSDRYSLYEIDEDDDIQVVSTSQICDLLRTTSEASLHPECHDWQDEGGGTWRAVPCDRDKEFDPDQIKLYVWTDEDNCRLFVAEHTDVSRFPWRNAN